MDFNNAERFREKIRSGQLCIGSDITFYDPAISELFGDVGYDFIWIDMEHNPLTLPDVTRHIMAVRGTSAAAFVRVPWNDPVLIKPVLELAPAGVIVPMIRSADEASLAVRSCKYPPKGIRGFGPRRANQYGLVKFESYLKMADHQTMVFIQIEHADAVRDLDAILNTPDLDGIAIGPMDLSASLGCTGQFDHPDFTRAVDVITEKVRETDLFFGISTGYLGEGVKDWLNRGIQWISYSTDLNNLLTSSKKYLQELRELDTRVKK